MAFGIGVGASGEEKQQYQNVSGLSSAEASMGLGDLSTSTDFMKAILSGDPTKIGQVLGPQIRGIQQQGQQQLQTMGQFGNRSGGTNAAAQTVHDRTRSTIDDLISSLTGASVSSLNSTGLGLVGGAQSGFGQAFNEAETMQKQKAAKWNDIIGSIASAATGVLGAIPGNPGGFADIAGNIAGSIP